MAKNNKHVVRQKLCLRKYNSAVNINLKNIVSGSIPTQNKGITLVTLSITIIILLIITTAGISTSLDRFEVNNYRKMKSDLELLEDKVSDYYLKYEGLPVLRTSDSNIEVFNYKEYIKGLTNTNQEPVTNANDNDIYYIIDLEALGNITLNYGRDFEKYKSNNVVQNVDTDIYIINEESHTIYYVKGIKMDDVIYHYIKKDEQITDDVPPTAPEIRVIFQNSWKAEIELLPGKDSWSGIQKIEYTISRQYRGITEKNDGETAENKTIILDGLGEYEISACCIDNNNIKSKKTTTTKVISISPPKIGDKIKYDVEYEDLIETNKTYTNIDGWGIVDINDDVCTIMSVGRPAKLYLTGREMEWWVNGEENFNEYLKNVSSYGKATWSETYDYYKDTNSLKIAMGLYFKFGDIKSFEYKRIKNGNSTYIDSQEVSGNDLFLNKFGDKVRLITVDEFYRASIRAKNVFAFETETYWNYSVKGPMEPTYFPTGTEDFWAVDYQSKYDVEEASYWLANGNVYSGSTYVKCSYKFRETRIPNTKCVRPLIEIDLSDKEIVKVDGQDYWSIIKK